jgi:hypothetical protein
MSFLTDLIWGTAEDKVVGVVNQELHLENFIQQGQEAKGKDAKGNIVNILNSKPNSKKNDINQAYTELYDYLVKKGVIKQELNIFSMITGVSVNTINKDIITNNSLKNETKLKNLIKINEIEINEKTNLQYYDINYNILSTFLTNYTYGVSEAVAEYAVIGKAVNGGKKNIKRKNKTKRKNKLK